MERFIERRAEKETEREREREEKIEYVSYSREVRGSERNREREREGVKCIGSESRCPLANKKRP